MSEKSLRVKRLVLLAMFTAIAAALITLVHFPLFPAAPYLQYDPADVPILIAAFAFGPAAGLIVTVLASFIQAFFLGGDGIYAADHNERLHVPCCPGAMVNTTGCGDAGMAAIAWAYLEGTDLAGTARAAMAAGAIAMESSETINPAMGAQTLKERMRLYEKQ